jgi:hypothetical protein
MCCALRFARLFNSQKRNARFAVHEDHQVIPRLTSLRLPREVLLEIFDRAVGERSNVTASDPAGSGGNEMRRWLTRYLRDEPALKALGWVACAHQQIEGIRNDALRIKLVMMNTDACTGMPQKQPRNIAEKGAASERLIGRNCRQQGLFEEADSDDPISDYDLWYFCAYVGEEHAAAEISRPNGIVAGVVSSFSERIIVCPPGEKSGLRRLPEVDEDFADIEKPTIFVK